jgi:hypothetical protein
MGRIILRRGELYDQVWKTPMVRLAAQYGISDVGLRKICQKLKIPTPKAGYWAKVQHGIRLGRPSLPRLGSGDKEEYILDSRSPGWKPRRKMTEGESLRITVPDKLQDPHPLVAKTLSVLKTSELDKYGVIRGNPGEILDVRIGPDYLDQGVGGKRVFGLDKEK